MQRSKKIKNIAVILASQEEIPEDVVTLLTKTLTKSELKLLGKFFRLELKKRVVKLSSPSELSVAQRDAFVKMYQPLDITFSVDKYLGGGIRVTKQDTVIDMSVKHYIIQMVQELTQ